MRKAGLFEQDRDLHAVRRGQRVELDPIGAPGGPFLGDRESGEGGHGELGESVVSAQPASFAALLHALFFSTMHLTIAMNFDRSALGSGASMRSCARSMAGITP